ncbi:hypothetical protein EDD11_004572 [Mortierella claussenii]|nr:hypothetical protein EDD11_004572 [Mortierella claussenii]
MPLGGPRNDITDIQLLCAKILCFCSSPVRITSSTATAPLFSPQTFAKRLITAAYPPQEQKQPLRLDRDRTQAPTPLVANGVVAMSALLDSRTIKLREYGLRILTSHRDLVQLDPIWNLLPSLKRILESLKDNLTRVGSADHALKRLDHDLGLTEDGKDMNSETGLQGPIKDRELWIATESKALSLLTWFVQEASKSSVTPLSSRHVNRMDKLKTTVSPALLVDLWRTVQHIFLFDGSCLPSGERLVAATTVLVYWVCWVFQDDAMTYVMREGADTLMAWYGYFIISREHASTSTVEAPLPSARGTPLLDKNDERSLKQPAYILEYLSKLIQNIVTPKRHQPSLFSMSRPVGIGVVIMRRTIEFLEDILESTLPVSVSQLPQENVEANDDILRGSEAVPKTISYSVRMIQERPGILDAMLGIMVGCIEGSQEGDQLILHSQLLNVLLLLLSNIQELFAVHPHCLTDSTARKVHQISLTILQWILKRDLLVPGVENVPLNHWRLGYTALVDWAMQPLEQEVEMSATPDISMSQDRTVTTVATMTAEGEMGIKALRVFALFWKHHPKGRNMLSDLMGPRLHQLRMVPLLIFSLDETPSSSGTAVGKSVKYKRDRTLLLLDTIIYFGCESSVRINMRERWSSLPFLVALLGASMKRLESNKFSLRDKLSRMAAMRCFHALRNFWYDRVGLVQLIELDLSSIQDGSESWRHCMPAAVLQDYQLLTSAATASHGSIVPLLLTITAPPYTVWSSELMLNSTTQYDAMETTQISSWRKRYPHPLFDQYDQLLVEAALTLSQLCQFHECQQRLIATPCATWMLSRLMVERTLVGNVSGASPIHNERNSSSNSPQELLERALFEALTRIVSSVDLAKSLVSNNTMTEIFAAVLEIDRPLHFYDVQMGFEGPTSMEDTKSEGADHVASDGKHNKQAPLDHVLKNDLQSQAHILPTPRQRDLHHQLLLHFQTAMLPLRGQFERIFHYVGGLRPLQDSDETSESVYWLREYCALVFLYTLDPPLPGSNSGWGSSRIDKNALLNSESALGVVCRMLTLEMDYENEPNVSAGQEGDDTQSRVVDEQEEQARLRRFSAGLAIQSLSWKHAEQWRQQHWELVESYMTVTTVEWESYVAALKRTTTGISSTGSNKAKGGTIKSQPMAVSFTVQGRIISFPDRALLSRSSSFFHTLLVGDFLEATQQHILLQDIDPDDFQMLMDVIHESQWTAQLLLPEDLSFQLVLRLMVCAERYMVMFVRRLAEAWILQNMRLRELRYYDTTPRANNSKWTEMKREEGCNKHGREDLTPELPREKRHKRDEDDDDGSVMDLEVQEEDVMRSQVDQEGHESLEDDSQESIQECLLMVYETCSDLRHGSLYVSTHPFYGLLWDALKRMTLRLGSVATLPRFASMLAAGGEEKIQELLRILFELTIDGDAPPPTNVFNNTITVFTSH